MVMWVFMNVFVEEHDNGMDLLTKIHPNLVWHLKGKIKAPMHCELAEEERWRLDILQTSL
jgi:hypothetical protein